MSFLFEKLTRAECEAVREADGFESGYDQGIAVGFEQGETSGFKKGETSGIAKGKFDEKCEIAVNLIKNGVDAKIISKATGLSEEEIGGLACNKQ